MSSALHLVLGIFATAVAATAAARPLPFSKPPATGFSAERLQRIRAAVQGTIDRKEFAGIEVAIARHGQLALTECFGFQDLAARKPMQPDTIFRLASMTKPIVCTAVMMLYDEGKFQLDDPVAKFIPGFDKVKVLAKEDGAQAQVVDLERPITIRDLLLHTSGLSNAKGYRAAFTRPLSLREWAAQLPSVPLAQQPGKAWRYGESVSLLGYLVEVWSHRSLDQFLDERMFRPLGMNDTGFYVPAGKRARLSKIYKTNERGEAEPMPQQPGDPSALPVFLSGSAGLYSTTGDYLRFCQMLLNGGQLDGKRLLSKTTVDLMLRNQVPAKLIPPNGPGGRKGYGFGIGGAILVDPSAAEIVGAEGEFTWGGTFGTLFWIDRQHELIGLWMMQQPPNPAPDKRFNGYREFKTLTYQALEN